MVTLDIKKLPLTWRSKYQQGKSQEMRLPVFSNKNQIVTLETSVQKQKHKQNRTKKHPRNHKK